MKKPPRTSESMLAVRLPPIRQQDNLGTEKGMKMETTTTTKEAYKGLRSTPVAAIRPQNQGIGQMTPFKGSTENSEAFTPKAIERVKAYRLKDNDIMSGSAFNATAAVSSGYNDDFGTRNVVSRTKSFAPHHEYHRPSAKFSTETTSKSDYRPYMDIKKLQFTNRNIEDHWNETQIVPNIGQSQSTYKSDFPDELKVGERMSYKPHTSTLMLGKEDVQLSTNYSDDFTFKSMNKPKSYAPLPKFVKPGVKMDSSTEAHDRYTGKYLPPPQSFRPKYELDPNRPPLDATTNYHDSFKKFRFSSQLEQADSKQ